MDHVTHGFSNIDEYIANFPEATQKYLHQIRATIHAAAPEAEEKISYQMPAFFWKGILVYFAGYKNHIGFYPTGSGIEAFKDDLSGYVTSKGTVRFPLDQPLPLDLIERMVRFRRAENEKKAEARTQKKKIQSLPS